MPGAKRPRRWVSLDTEFLARPRTVELRKAFGAAGPLTLLALVLECERTELGRTTDTVEARYGPIAEMAGTTGREVRQILGKAESLGLLAVTTHSDPVTGREFDRVTLRKRPRWTSRPASHWRASDAPRRIPTDERVIAALRATGRPIPAAELAAALGLLYSGSFRARLKRLRDTGMIVLDDAGYTLGVG